MPSKANNLTENETNYLSHDENDIATQQMIHDSIKASIDQSHQKSSAGKSAAEEHPLSASDCSASNSNNSNKNAKNNVNTFRKGLSFNKDSTQIASAQPANNRLQNICNQSFAYSNLNYAPGKNENNNTEDILFNNS